ncbi:MAG: hypothetical protein Kow0092_22710 [Deferrisomatales bacterium]
MRPLRLAAVLLLLFATASHGAAPSTPRVGIKVLPFTGFVFPHQDISGDPPGPALGVGLEIHYLPRTSFVLDLSQSFHRDLKVSSLQLLARRRFDTRPWVLFAQAGAGGYQAEVEGDRQFGGPGLSVGGGVEVPVGGALSLQLEGRSNWAKGFASVGNDTGWIGHTQALLWVVYKLP